MRATVTNPGDDPTVVAYLQIGNDIQARTLSTTAKRGDAFDTEWTVAPSGAAAAGAIPLPARLGEVVVGLAAGTTAEAALAAPHHEDHYSYRVDGTTAEVLTPGRPMLKRFNKKGKPRLQRAEPSPSLEVDISAVRSATGSSAASRSPCAGRVRTTSTNASHASRITASQAIDCTRSKCVSQKKSGAYR